MQIFYRKGVKDVGDIIIRDQTTGEVQKFTPTAAGYAAAQEMIDTIKQSGHIVESDDLARVHKYTGR